MVFRVPCPSPCWGPWWPGTQTMNFQTNPMGTSTKKSKTDSDSKKRPLQNSESEDENSDVMFSQAEFEEASKQHEARREELLKQHLESRAHCLPRFFFKIAAVDPEHPITKHSPFVIKKAISGTIGTVKSIKKMYRPSTCRSFL